MPKKAFVLIEATNGIGKSILAQRLAYGTKKNNHKVSYISSEMSVTEFINQMVSLNYDIRKDILNKNFKFVTLFSGFKKIDIKHNLIEKILSSKEIFDSDIIVFDTISEFLVKDDIDLKGCFNLISRFKSIAMDNKTFIFCVDPSMINEKFLSVLRSVSDVYFKLEEKDLYGNKIRLMKIERFNGAAGDVENEVPFKVKAGVGIIPELTS